MAGWLSDLIGRKQVFLGGAPTPVALNAGEPMAT